MILYKEIPPLRQYLAQCRLQGKKAGFVPTMGALHAGHLSLIERSRRENDLTVCSIFINPTQFNDPGDFAQYPVTIERDVLQLERAGTEVLFLPSVGEMYPNGTTLQQPYPLGYLETVLEGAHRPGHFQGVCQVVHRLLTVVEPGKLYLGQKDYQQVMVLRRLVQLASLPVDIVMNPTLREADGLAMSSRNQRLPPASRQQATAIYRALQQLRQQLPQENLDQAKAAATALLLREGFERVDYVEICLADTLAIATEADKHQPLLALAAAFIGGVRLIDNLLL